MITVDHNNERTEAPAEASKIIHNERLF